MPMSFDKKKKKIEDDDEFGDGKKKDTFKIEFGYNDVLMNSKTRLSLMILMNSNTVSHLTLLTLILMNLKMKTRMMKKKKTVILTFPLGVTLKKEKKK